MNKIFIIFPNQLFKDTSPLKEVDAVYLVEEYLFFNQYKFHKQKLALHRASMKYYESYLLQQGIRVIYIEAITPEADIRNCMEALGQIPINTLCYYDVCDDWLQERITTSCNQHNIKIYEYTTPLFINTKKDLETYFGERKKYFQTDFYIQQRKRLNILIDENGKPKGGKWSFDAENRLKYPKNKKAPTISYPGASIFYDEAVQYVEKYYGNNYGNLAAQNIYPISHKQSEVWLHQFLSTRFNEFGEYEDAIVDKENILHHSVLTPLLNIGLLLPQQIVHAALDYATNNEVSLNSLEGFIRQIIGWREFIRGVYIYKGKQERSTNYWNFSKSIPTSFYTGTTHIEPIDTTIKKLLQTGYNHHIERLMILGNFMLLCEFHPNKVYQWFMEMYIDAYDWVMVPNIYGMSQFADGGLMATKPYISGSSYVLKMSNYAKGNWCSTWDALFWHFMNKHRKFFLSNPRLGMLIKTYDKMSEQKKNLIEQIIQKLDTVQ